MRKGAMSLCGRKYLRYGVKILVVFMCVGGFIYQTMMFMFFYWTYPTVVDIQVTSPSYIDMPAFTFCNHIGYKLDEFCEINAAACPNQMLLKYSGICSLSPHHCIDGNIPAGFAIILYTKFAQLVEFGPEIHEKVAMKLEDYLNCTIEFAGETKKCNMTSVMGSFYSNDDLPNYCFTIYSKWGQPNKQQEKIAKGSTMKLHFYLNATQRPFSDREKYMRFNQPSTAAVQIAIHSPYYLPSPFLLGSGFIGGRSYEIELKQEEKHLLPAPYQTNCTDYMSEWRSRGGKSPVNQLMFIQECKLNHSYETRGCVPLSIDYPHDYNICKRCGKTNPCKETDVPRDNCTTLAEHYNQPCDFISYEVQINDKIITIPRILKNPYTRDQEGINEKKIAKIVNLTTEGCILYFYLLEKNKHECGREQQANVECSTVDVEIFFERFEITNLTYNPKYESMETFSVVGGYLGMWLGVSLVAVYDFISTVVVVVKNSCSTKTKNKRRKGQILKRKLKPTQLTFHGKDRKLHPSLYDEETFKAPSTYSRIYHY